MCWNVVMFPIHNCGCEPLFQTISQLFESFTTYMKLDATVGGEMLMSCHFIVMCLLGI